MNERMISASLLIVAVIHLLPLSGVFGVDRLSALYDIEIDDPNVEILMRHRAVLFAILGAFIGIAAFKEQLQVAAFILAFISIASFLFLAISIGEYNAAIRRVVSADVIAAILLLVAMGLYYARR